MARGACGNVGRFNRRRGVASCVVCHTIIKPMGNEKGTLLNRAYLGDQIMTYEKVSNCACLGLRSKVKKPTLERWWIGTKPLAKHSR